MSIFAAVLLTLGHKNYAELRTSNFRLNKFPQDPTATAHISKEQFA